METSKAHILARLQKDIFPLQGYKPLAGNIGFDGGLGFIKHAFPNASFPLGAIHELFWQTSWKELRRWRRLIMIFDNDNNRIKKYQQISLQLLDKQRELLHQMNHHSEFDEDIIRKHLSLPDLEETRLREKIPEEQLVK